MDYYEYIIDDNKTGWWSDISLTKWKLYSASSDDNTFIYEDWIFVASLTASKNEISQLKGKSFPHLFSNCKCQPNIHSFI